MTGRQCPGHEEMFLDHLAHFVPDMERASAELARLGFTLTPFTAQYNRTPSGMQPAGTANRCIMLRSGYVEIITTLSDTQLARRAKAAMARYTGVHLIAFSVEDADETHARLANQGFQPDSPVHLRRPVDLEHGTTAEAAFTVLRVPAERMPEGRIQVLRHHTVAAVWQPRWMVHDNGIVSLEAVLSVVEDPEEAAARYARFTGRKVEKSREGGRWVLPLDRGRLVFIAPTDIERHAPWLTEPPSLPWIAAYALGSADCPLTRERFAAAGVTEMKVARDETAHELPQELGGFLTIAPAGHSPSWTA